MNAHRTWPPLLAPLLALLGGCSLAPRYQVPAVAVVDHYKEAGEWVPANPADAEPRGDWWQAFGDPQLNQLQEQLRAASPELQAATARYQQARAVALSAWSGLYPALGGSGSARRARSSANAPHAAGVSTLDNDFTFDGNVSWELDLFGRLRNQAVAARARRQASAGDLAALALALQAELTSDYFALRGNDAIQQLFGQTVQAYDRAAELTRNRYDGGIASATDVEQAETQRQSAAAQLAALRLQRAQLEHAIAILLGQAPANFALAPAPLEGALPPLGTPLPSTLLLRRPDVASAERQLAAANAGIGAARAAWFPAFSLAGAAGYESTTSSNWLAAPSRFWAAGPALQLPLFDAGARVAHTRQAHAIFAEALANYRQVALTAYREVEDNLAALHYLGDGLAADEAAAAAAKQAAFHANQRYLAGVADYVEVTSTQTASLQSQRAALETRIAQLNAAVALTRALGGGWSAQQLERPLQP